MSDLTDLANVKAWLNLGQVTENAAIPAAPGPYTVTVAKAAAWNGDAWVILAANGAGLLRVAGVPAAGQYAVAAGVYTFNAAQAGQALSITYTTLSPQDPMLARLITAASRTIEAYIGRRIASQSYTEVRHGHGGVQMAFANTPVTAVSLVKVDGAAIPLSPDLGHLGYFFSPTMLYLVGCSFTRGAGNVEIAYTAGYAATPSELEQACIELVALRFKERDHIGQDSASMQGQNITFSQEMPAHLKAVLNDYKKVVPV